MLGIHAASGTIYIQFVRIVIFVSLHVPAGACIPVGLLVRLQFMYFQYNVYLSIVVRTNIVYIIHMIQNNLRTPQLAGEARQLGCKKYFY